MTSVVQFRMDSNDKEVLEAMLKDMGTAFRMFVAKVLKTPKKVCAELIHTNS